MSAGKDETGLQIRMWAAAGAGGQHSLSRPSERAGEAMEQVHVRARPRNKSTCGHLPTGHRVVLQTLQCLEGH